MIQIYYYFSYSEIKWRAKGYFNIVKFDLSIKILILRTC